MPEVPEAHESAPARLDRLTKEHAEEYLALMDQNREYFAQYNNTPVDKYRTVDDVLESFADPKRTRWGVRNEENELIGMLTVSELSESFAEDAREVGYAIAESATGSGVATSVVKEVVNDPTRYAETDEVRQLIAYTHPDNLPSQKVLTNAGFNMTGYDHRTGEALFWLPLSPQGS